jgi:hypothetical protein
MWLKDDHTHIDKQSIAHQTYISTRGFAKVKSPFRWQQSAYLSKVNYLTSQNSKRCVLMILNRSASPYFKNKTKR